MNPKPTTLARLALVLGALTLSLLAMPAHAGTESSPEISDGPDDVTVNGGTNCPAGLPSPPGPCVAGQDFIWPDADMIAGWFNDTATTIFLHIKNMSSFSPGEGSVTTQAGSTPPAPVDWNYDFHFTYRNVTYEAKVTYADNGNLDATGVATAAAIHGQVMDITVPKSGLPGITVGAVLSNPWVTAHGDVNGASVDDRAPDAGVTAADYVVKNGTLATPATTWTDVSDATFAANLNQSAAATHFYFYNWTSGPASAHLSLDATLASGNLTVLVADASGSTIYAQVLQASGHDVKDLTGKAGLWHVGIIAGGLSGSVDLTIAPGNDATPTTTPTTTPTVTPTTTPTVTPTPSTSGKASPGIEFAANIVAVGLVVVALRRRAA